MNRTRLIKEFEHLLTSDDVAQNTHPIRVEGDCVSWLEDPFIMSLVALGALDFHQAIRRLEGYPEKQRELARKMGYSLQAYERLSYVRRLGDNSLGTLSSSGTPTAQSAVGVPEEKNPQKKKRRKRKKPE